MKLNDIRELSKDDLLSVLGLATKPTTTQRLIGGLGMFTVGLVVGAGAALLLAPKSGQDLREDLGQRLRDLRESASNAAVHLDSEVSSAGAGLSEDEIRT